MKKIFSKRLCLILVIIASQENKLFAQPFNLTETVQPVELAFSEYTKAGEAKAKGRISMNTYTQEVDTSYYFIKGLSMYAPTYFSLNTTDPGADIKINLCKENWHVFHHTGNISGKSIWKCNFKTEGDFGIMVIAKKKPAKYVLLVWSGDELKVEMPAVFKKPGDEDIKGAGWLKQHKMWLIIGAASLVFIAFIILRLKNKKS